MKKLIQVSAVLLVFLLVLPVSATAASQGIYHWYCKRTPEHKQPPLDKEISFIKEYNGYYIDEAHGDNTAEKVVYLTFDAGYENGNVEKILNILKQENVPGAFFVLGHFISANQDLVKRMAAEGHCVCNHTYSHKDVTKLSVDQFQEELKKLETLYSECTGEKMSPYYRPPEGKFSLANMKAASEMGYKTIFWSFAYADWDNHNQPSLDYAKEKILSNIHNGAILLLHPTSETNAAILSDVIKELKNQGYRFGTLDDLAQ